MFLATKMAALTKQGAPAHCRCSGLTSSGSANVPDGLGRLAPSDVSKTSGSTAGQQFGLVEQIPDNQRL
jgi:hypothetical protein